MQIQKPNAISIGKATSLNMSNIKSTKNNQQTIKLVNQTIGGSGSVNTTTIKHVSSTGIKTISSTPINSVTIGNSAVTPINSNAIQQKNQTKSSKLFKNNNNSSSTSKVCICKMIIDRSTFLFSY